MNEVFTHWIVWTVATFGLCAFAYQQMRVSRPMVAVMVALGALATGLIKECTDTEFILAEVTADAWGVGLGVLLFFLLVRRRRLA